MITAELANDRIEITCEYRDRELVKLVPGTKWDSNRRVWYTPLSWTSCKALRGVFGERLHVGPALSTWAAELYRNEIYPALMLHHETDAEGDERLYPFQRVGVKFMQIADGAILADDMGTGKTIQSIIALLTAGPEALPAVVVCPNSMKGTWKRELEKWAPQLSVGVLRGGAVQRRKVLDEKPDVVVMNWQQLRLHSRLAPYGSIALKHCEECDRDSTNKRSVCERCPKELNERTYRTVIADEAHNATNPKAKQTRALWAVAANAKLRIALTGTPIKNAIDDLWAILHFINPREWPSKSKFIDRYALTSWNAFGGMDVIGVKPETAAEFFATVDPHLLRRPKEAVLPFLPAKTYVERYVELSAKQKKMYKTLKEKLAVKLDEGGIVLAVNPLTLMTRLSQAAAAYAEIDDEGNLRLAEPSNKLDVMMEILAETDPEPVVFFAESRQLIELAEKRLEKAKIPFASIHGNVSEVDRQVAVERFQSGQLRAILVTIGAGGEGITLTRSRIAVFLQRSWSMVKNKQAEDRIHRIGQDADKVLIIDVLSEDTLEDDKQLRLAEKQNRMQEIVRDQSVIERLLR